MKKIITFNVNGIRAALSKGLLEWLKATDADIICIQETKAQTEQIPLIEFQSIGYQTYHHEAKKKGYSGVLILSKEEPLQVTYGINLPKFDDEGRLIMLSFGEFSILNTYIPSGTTGDERQQFKMEYLDCFYNYISNLLKTYPNLIICGDFNICHEAIDIHDPKGNAKNSGFLPEEREWITKFLNIGFVDSFRFIKPDSKEYTWWTYRFNARANNKGWRIDYEMVSKQISNKIKDVAILSEVLFSDHCPMLLEVNF